MRQPDHPAGMPDHPFTVFLVDQAQGIGGAEAFLVEAEQYLRQGISRLVVVLANEGPLADRLRLAGIEVVVIPISLTVLTLGKHHGPGHILRAALGFISLFLTIVRMARLFRSASHAVVYTYSIKADVYGAVAARLAGKPCVWHMHDLMSPKMFPWTYRHLLTWIANRTATQVLCNSWATRGAMIAAGLRPSLASVVHLGVDAAKHPDPIAVAKVRAEFTDHGGPLIGLIGRIAPWKGQIVLVEAAPYILEVVPEVRFLLVGDAAFGKIDTDYEALLRRRIAALGLEDRVILTGFRPDVAAIIQACDLVVHTSVKPEAFGLVIIEAMAQGKLVLAARAGGVPEIIEDGRTGLLLQPGDAPALARTCSHYLQHPEEAARLGAAAREVVRQRFSLQSSVQQITQILRAVTFGEHPARLRTVRGTPSPTFISRGKRQRYGSGPLRLLFCSHTGQVAGAEQSLLSILEWSRDAGHTSILCSPAGPLADRAAARGMTGVPISSLDVGIPADLPSLAHLLTHGLILVRQLRRVVRQEKPDIVHANSLRAGLIVMIALQSLPRRPRLVIHARDALRGTRFGLLLSRTMIRGADAMVAISDYVAGHLGPADRKIHMLHNAIDPTAFRPDPTTGQALRIRLGVPTTAPLLAVVGQITPWKGQMDAVEAFALIKKEYPRAHLLIAGEAKFTGKHRRYDTLAYGRELRQRATELHLADSVHFPGELPDPAVIYAAADLILVPSWAEPFGRVVIEAMAAGCPVVATNAGGIPEIITHTVDGWLVPAQEPSALAEAAERLLGDPTLREQLAEEGMHTVERRFSRDPYMRELERIWRSVLT